MISVISLRPIYKKFLWLVLIAEVLGSIYGYYWYKEQLSQTPWYYWLFTWDCPFYATLFSFWLYSYLKDYKLHKSPLFTAITWTGLMKYGLWTVIVVQDSYVLGGPVTTASLGLQISHTIMFVEGLVLLSLVSFRNIGWVVSWMILNDFMDYGVGTYPWMMEEQVRMAMWLAISSTIVLYGLMMRMQIKSWLSKKYRLFHQNDLSI